MQVRRARGDQWLPKQVLPVFIHHQTRAGLDCCLGRGQQDARAAVYILLLRTLGMRFDTHVLCAVVYTLHVLWCTYCTCGCVPSTLFLCAGYTCFFASSLQGLSRTCCTQADDSRKILLEAADQLHAFLERLGVQLASNVSPKRCTTHFVPQRRPSRRLLLYQTHGLDTVTWQLYICRWHHSN